MTDVTERRVFAAACLLGRPTRSVRLEDVRDWQENHLLLPIANALERDGESSQVDTHVVHDTMTAVRRVAAATEAAECRVIGEVLGALDGAGVEVLLLKGAALAYTVYPQPWLRARSDIDLLIRPGSMPGAADALARIDFEGAREVSHPLITRQRHFMRRRRFRAAVDVHETLVNPPVLRTLPEFDVLNSRAQTVRGLSGPAKALATPDALLHALVHRVAHHNSSADLLWLYDMHLLIARMSPADWTTLVATACDARVCRIARDGLDVLAATLGTAVPADVLDALHSSQPEPSAALLGGDLTEWQLQWINFRSLRSWRERVEFVRAHLLPPSRELATDLERQPILPLSYVSRALHGARKWRRPISRQRA